MRVYLDASVIVASVLDETNSASAVELIDRYIDTVITSDLAMAEVSRRSPAGCAWVNSPKTSPGGCSASRHRRVPDRRHAPITPTDIRDADRLIRRLDLKLRAPDAIHLAVAARLEATLLTFDAGLADAARVLNRPVLGA